MKVQNYIQRLVHESFVAKRVYEKPIAKKSQPTTKGSSSYHEFLQSPEFNNLAQQLQNGKISQDRFKQILSAYAGL